MTAPADDAVHDIARVDDTGCRTVVELFARVVAAHGGREAFVEASGRRITFADWDDLAARVAGSFAAAGVGRGDVVCLGLPSSIGYAVCYQAALRLGAITTGINPRLGAAERAHILDATEPKVFVDDLADVDALTRGEPVAVDGRAMSHEPTDPVAIVWTSGTTGVPKGAVFDHACLRAMVVGAGALSAPGDRRLSPLPFAHVAYMTRVWDELVHVITTVIAPTPWSAAESLRLMADERVTVGQGVPTQWRLVLDQPDITDVDLSSLRLVSTGAAPAPPELIREMRERLGAPVVVRYASTEACLISGTRIGDPDDVVATTVGRASGGVELRVVDEDTGEDVATGEVGAVRCRSRAVMRGYWRDPVRTAEVIGADGWLRTGDLGRFDEAGNLTLAGRRVEMYLRGGYNVYPAEVEAVLSAHPGVARVAVVGGDDPVLGHVGHAFVVPVDPGAPPTRDDLRAWVRDRLADYKAPDLVHVRDDLPLTAMQKIDKRALLASLDR